MLYTSGTCSALPRMSGKPSMNEAKLLYLEPSETAEVTVQVPVSIFLDKSPRIVYRMVDECESVSPENAEARGLGESSSALEPAQPCAVAARKRAVTARERGPPPESSRARKTDCRRRETGRRR